MKHILECSEIQQEYLLFALAPEQHHDRIIDLANLWVRGLELRFDRVITQPTQQYLDQYAETEEEYFLLFFMPNEGYDDHPRYGESWDMRFYDQMQDLRQFLMEL